MKKGTCFAVFFLLAAILFSVATYHFMSNTDLTKLIEVLESDLLAKDSEIENLNGTSTENEAKILALIQENTNQADRIKTITANVSERDKKIVTLNSDIIESKGQISIF